MSIEPNMLVYLVALEDAVANLKDTWRPDDPQYRADWAPLWNPVYTLQPNPDDIYLQSPIRGDLAYRVSGNRGTCRILSFTTQKALSGTVDQMPQPSGHNEINSIDLELEPGQDFEVIFSARRPAGYAGKWAPIDPEADGMMVRFRSYNWASEIDPVLTIECLDAVPLKPRLTPDQILARIQEMGKFPARKTRLYYGMQNGVKQRVGFNVFEPVRYPGALVKQVYWPACFQLAEDEALIIETELPTKRPYWNIQLNDPYFNTLEYVYRLSSTNGHYARVSTDGRFRGVISQTDPGVPNWLDPAGYTEGGIYGRWYDCDSEPVPTIQRVKLSALREHLPQDTPVVSPAERADEIRQRVKACQRRRRW
jgi:hypothetical protein